MVEIGFCGFKMLVYVTLHAEGGSKFQIFIALGAEKHGELNFRT